MNSPFFVTFPIGGPWVAIVGKILNSKVLFEFEVNYYYYYYLEATTLEMLNPLREKPCQNIVLVKFQLSELI